MWPCRLGLYYLYVLNSLKKITRHLPYWFRIFKNCSNIGIVQSVNNSPIAGSNLGPIHQRVVDTSEHKPWKQPSCNQTNLRYCQSEKWRKRLKRLVTLHAEHPYGAIPHSNITIYSTDQCISYNSTSIYVSQSIHTHETITVHKRRQFSCFCGRRHIVAKALSILFTQFQELFPINNAQYAYTLQQ